MTTTVTPASLRVVTNESCIGRSARISCTDAGLRPSGPTRVHQSRPPVARENYDALSQIRHRAGRACRVGHFLSLGRCGETPRLQREEVCCAT